MKSYNFSGEEAELLMECAVQRSVEAGIESVDSVMGGRDARAVFVRWCRIVAELHAPAPATLALGAYMGPLIDSETEQMREACRREGISYDKEMGPMDPRAFNPRCVHGKLRTEPCEKCDNRCSHGLTMDEPCAGCERGVAKAADTEGGKNG